MTSSHENIKPARNDYFELRIPKFSKGGPPLLVTLLLMLVSFGAGLLTMRFYYEKQATGVVTDANSAFVSYAKQLKLNTKDFASCLQSGKYTQKVTTDIDTASSLQVNATPTFFINGRLLVGAQPYELFQQMIEQELSGSRSPLTPEEASTSAQADVAKGQLPVLGKSDAKLTIIEFSDFQCPFCERFYLDTLPQLKKDYIDTGKVQLAFRHFPIASIHPNAKTAHEAAECANEQGKFWEYHDLLFQTQEQWSNLPLAQKATTT